MKNKVTKKRIDLDIDINLVLSRILFNEKDIVIIGGTLIEGIGNKLSDIDVNIITNKRPTFEEIKGKDHIYYHKKDMSMCEHDNDEVFMIMDYYQGSDFHLDVEYWTFDEFERTQKKVSTIYDSLFEHADNNYQENSLTRKEKLLLHRCINGSIANGNKEWDLLRGSFLTEKISYVEYRSIANYYYKAQDIMGAVDAEDMEYAVELSRQYVIREVRGSIYLNGYINPAEKWFIVLWKILCESVHEYKKYENDFFEIIFFKEELDPIPYILNCFKFIESIESINRKILDDNIFYLNCSKSISLIRHEFEERDKKIKSPVQDHEKYFRLRTYTSKHKSYSELLFF